ncbi:hypothetical protein [Luteimonas qiangzhengi]|uniref:hypothetical protein n=1 Tax=Luteimonas sp. MJ146 TaxID=3129240 RepID=UPI0031BA6077
MEIQAGDIVGHLGEYQRYLDMDALAQCSSGRPLAQMDVFTHEDLAGFIAQSRSRDAQLDARQKTLLHVRPGARLVQPSKPDIELEAGEAVVQIEDDGDGRWVMGRKGTVAIVDQRAGGFNAATRTYGDGRIFIAAVDAEGNEITLDEYNALPDKTSYPRRKLLTPTGSEVWVSRGTADQQALVTSPGRAWSRSPLQAANARGEAVGYSRVIPVAAIEESLKEADGTRWFQVDAPTSSGELTRGWVRESGHSNVEICSPWAWPGFELFDVAELEPRELFARELAASGRAQPQERDEFDNTARNIEQSPLFAALGRAIDRDGNREITPLELRNALKTEWLADAISRLVIRYPSEWSDPTDRWSRIDDLIEDETLRKDWEHEKGRIEKFTIWSEVAGQHGFPSNSDVHHLHSIGFIENFFSRQEYDCLTYRILYEDGSLERITPSDINPAKTNIIRYIYVDAIGSEHDLGEYTFILAGRVGPGNAQAEGIVRLMDLRDVDDYASGDVRYGFHYDERLTLRPYVADDAMASLFGAMLDTSFVDVSCNGFSDHRGHSIGGSSSHRNGVNGDFKYFRADGTTQDQTSLHIDVNPELMDEERQNRFNDALRKYGWSDLRAWRYVIGGESRLLRHTQHLRNHQHHLHLQGYSPTIAEINEN